MRLLVLMNETTGAVIALIILAAVSEVMIFHRRRVANLLRTAKTRTPRWLFEIVVALISGIALLTLLLGFRQLASSVVGFAHYVWAAPMQGLTKDQLALDNTVRANRIQITTTVAQSLGGLAVLIGIVVAWANLRTTQKAQKATERNQTETVRLTNEGQITDRFTRAIEQLGSGQLEVRLGGIYALERIARDSEKDHWPIMEVLTAYIRVHAPVHEADNNAATIQPDPDIQAILTVIGRRGRTLGHGEDVRLNLTGIHLEVADLRGAHLEGADLRGVRLDRADLRGAHLNGASLEFAILSSVYLSDADLTGAYLRGADLKDANILTQAQVDSAIGNRDTKLPPGLVMPKSWKDNL